MSLHSYWFFLAIHFIVALPAAAQVRHEYSEVHMGMPVRIVLYAPTDSSARSAARAAFQRIAQLDAQLSDYRSTSELHSIEARAPEWFPVSTSTLDVLTRALDIARKSDGAFDPTVGPLVLLWRTARKTGQLPARAALDSARSLVSHRHLEIDATRSAARLARAGMRLDLGGIAKGFILQEALRTLQQQGITQALLEAGGDIVVGARPPGPAGWRIDVPGADSAFQKRAHRLEHAALATSGPASQFITIAGVRYSHVVDPRTGMGLTDARTAHVIAHDGALADALATALTLFDGVALLARFPEVIAVSVH